MEFFGPVVWPDDKRRLVGSWYNIFSGDGDQQRRENKSQGDFDVCEKEPDRVIYKRFHLSACRPKIYLIIGYGCFI
jgi:hypothetical protein